MTAEIAIALIVIPPALLWAGWLIYVNWSIRRRRFNGQKNVYAVEYDRKGSTFVVWDVYADTPNEAMKYVMERYSASSIKEVSLKVIEPDNPNSQGYQVVWTAPRKNEG